MNAQNILDAFKPVAAGLAAAVLPVAWDYFQGVDPVAAFHISGQAAVYVGFAVTLFHSVPSPFRKKD